MDEARVNKITGEPIDPELAAHNAAVSVTVEAASSGAWDYAASFVAKLDGGKNFQDIRGFLVSRGANECSHTGSVLRRAAHEVLYLAAHERDARVKRALLHAAVRVLCVDTNDGHLVGRPGSHREEEG